MKNTSTLNRILSYTKPYFWHIFLAIISAGINVAAVLYAPVLIGDGVDLIIEQNNVDFYSLFLLALKLTLVVIIAAIFNRIMMVSTNSLSYKTVNDLRTETYRKINKLPMKHLDATSRGDLISRVVVDIEQISDGMLQGFSQLLTGILTIVGTIFFMMKINFTISMVVILITPLSLFVAGFITKKSHDKFKERASLQGEISGHAEETIGNQKLVKAFSYEEKSQKSFEEINAKLYKCGVMAQFYSALANPCTRFVNSLVYAGAGVFGAIVVINGGVMTVGQIATFLSYANQYTKPFNEITGVITEFQASFAAAKRVFNVLDETEIIDLANSDFEKTEADDMKIDGNISIKDIVFSYDNNAEPFMNKLSLEVKSGQKIAVVGPTGCGKTTLINLIMRFYEISSGEIYIDETNISDISREKLRSYFGMVLQDSWIFSGTVRENIAYAVPNASDEEIVEAAKKAHAHSFVKKLENGYDTMLSEDGGNLSSGQKQLICIARIMLANPPMLILDEATSSIDTMTEQRVQKAFTNIMKGRTSIVIAHRLSTIKDADCIVVMKDGAIIETGNHDELLAKNGLYHTLYNAQFEKTK